MTTVKSVKLKEDYIEKYINNVINQLGSSEYFTLNQLVDSNLLGSRTTLHRAMSSGDLKFYRQGIGKGKLFISKPDIKIYMKKTIQYSG